MYAVFSQFLCLWGLEEQKGRGFKVIVLRASEWREAIKSKREE